MNGLIKIKTGINHELFKIHFNFQRPKDMLKTVYTTNNRKKNDNLLNVINSRLTLTASGGRGGEAHCAPPPVGFLTAVF